MQPQTGLRLRLLKNLDDPFNPYQAGEEGTIQHVDDAGQIHVKWDSGGSLAVIPEEDEYEIFNQVQGLLNFNGMTPEQIEEFIVNTQISYEVDASIETQISASGILHEEEPDNIQSTGWLSGMILGTDVSNNIGLALDDAYLEALRFYKQANFDLEGAADDFDAKYGPLL